MAFHRDSAEARDAGVTYHLVQEAVWEQARDASTYVPEAFPSDGFIHCTDGLDEILNVANRFYQGQPGDYVILAISVPDIESDVRYDDPDEVYPHVYGPLNTSAVMGVVQVVRDDDGRFLAIGKPPGDALST